MKGERPDHAEEIDSDTYKIEVNLDDTSGELLGYVMDRLFEAGARDVFYVPIYMKKNRPGVMLSVLCKGELRERLCTIILHETTTLGVRYYPVTVHRLARNFRRLRTRWGEVRVKQGFYEGKLIEEAPEYEDCRSIAESHDVALKEVYREVWRLLGSPTESPMPPRERPRQG